MTLAQLLHRLKQSLPAHEAREILCHCLGVTASELILRSHEPAAPEVREKAEQMAQSRSKGMPLQYILGTWDFYGLTFCVDERALIPRPDTEVLVERAEALCRSHNYRTLLDVCTGTGCIAIALSKALGIHADAADISEAALSLCAENIARNGADVTPLHSDLFFAVTQKYGIITSNPPYIPTADIAELDDEVKDHEPMLALDGGADGLDFYRRIADRAKEYLQPGGALVLEVGVGQAQSVADLLKENGYASIRITPDYAGIDRVVEGIHN